MNRTQIICGHAQKALTFDQKYEHESTSRQHEFFCIKYGPLQISRIHWQTRYHFSCLPSFTSFAFCQIEQLPSIVSCF